jgi:arabinofuranosyltransferase
MLHGLPLAKQRAHLGHAIEADMFQRLASFLRRLGPPLRQAARSPAWAYRALAAAALLVVLTTWLSLPVSYDIGAPDDEIYVRQFYPAEHWEGTRFRWTKAVSYVDLPNALHFGEQVQLMLRVGGWPEDLGRPHVQVWANRRLLLDVQPPRSSTQYRAVLSGGEYPDQNLDLGEVVLEIHSSTVSPPGDSRQLGIVLDEIRLQRLPQWWFLGVWLALAVAIWLFLRGRGRRPDWIARYLTAFLLAIAFGSLVYRPQLLPYTPYMACVALAGLLVLPVLLRRPWEGTALWIILLFFLLLPQLLGTWIMDDSYISFRYAQNLARGNGLVYNPGEVVEGYTNFLWTMLAALALALGGHLPALAGLANTLLGMGTLVLVYHLGRRAIGRLSAWSLVPALVLALNGAFAAYTVTNSGMETALFTFLVTLAMWLFLQPDSYSRGSLRASPVLALATLTRPEGILVFGLTFLYTAWLAWRDRRAWHSLLGPALLFLTIFLPYYIWRFAYYGYLLPNTFYAKTGGGLYQVWRGVVYVWDYLLFRGPPMALVALIGAILLWWAWRRRRAGRAEGTETQPPPAGSTPLLPYLALLVAVYVAYVVWVGGDHFPGFRFLVPIAPALALLFLQTVRAIARWVERPRRSRTALTYALAAILLLSQVMPVLRLLPQGELWDGLADGLSYVVLKGYSGLWIRENTPPETVLVATGAGAIAYFAERRTIDAWGLNDLYIGHKEMPTMGQGSAGHEKKDIDYVLAQKPDYILCIWLYYFENDPRLDRDYRVYKVLGADGTEICWYQRIDHR